MNVKQLSVFLENKMGRLAEATRVLGENNINIRALAVADTADFGVLRMIVNDPDKALGVLKQAGFTVSETDVVVVEVSDRAGGLADVLGVLASRSINIEYLYCFVQKNRESVIVVLRIEDIARAKEVLSNNGFNIPSAQAVYSI